MQRRAWPVESFGRGRKFPNQPAANERGVTCCRLRAVVDRPRGLAPKCGRGATAASSCGRRCLRATVLSSMRREDAHARVAGGMDGWMQAGGGGWWAGRASDRQEARTRCPLQSGSPPRHAAAWRGGARTAEADGARLARSSDDRWGRGAGGYAASRGRRTEGARARRGDDGRKRREGREEEEGESEERRASFIRKSVREACQRKVRPSGQAFACEYVTPATWTGTDSTRTAHRIRPSHLHHLFPLPLPCTLQDWPSAG